MATSGGGGSRGNSQTQQPLYSYIQRSDGAVLRRDNRTGAMTIAQAARTTNSGNNSGSSTQKSTPAVYNDDGTIKYTYNGKTYSVKPASEGGYMQAFRAYANDVANTKTRYEDQYNTNTQNLANTLAQNNATTNANYDNSARQAYVDYMRKQRALPSQLQALGVRGGATESGLLNLYNAYGAEHAANEQQRNADLTSNQQAYDDALAKLVAERTEYLNEYDRDLAAQRQTALNNQMNEYRNDLTTYSASIARFTADEKGYKEAKAELKKLQKSKDPLKEAKINILKQQMASVFTAEVLKEIGNGGSSGGSSSGGSSGGGYRRSYGGGGSSGGGNNNNEPVTKKGYEANTRKAYEDRFKKSKTTTKKKSKTTTKKKSKASNTWKKYGINLATGGNRWVG